MGIQSHPCVRQDHAYTVTHDRDHELIEGFRLSRFAEYELTGKRARRRWTLNQEGIDDESEFMT